MVVDVDSAVVETSQKPRFCGVEIDAFDVIQPIIIIISKELFLQEYYISLGEYISLEAHTFALNSRRHLWSIKVKT